MISNNKKDFVDFINHKREAAALLVRRKGGGVFMQQQQKAIFGFLSSHTVVICDNSKQLLSARSFVRLLLISRMSVCLSHVAANRHAAEDRRKFLNTIIKPTKNNTLLAIVKIPFA
jgi:hypothetical protein